MLQAHCLGEMVMGEVPLQESEAEKRRAAVDTASISPSSTSLSGDAQSKVFLHFSHSRVLRTTLELAFTVASVYFPNCSTLEVRKGCKTCPGACTGLWWCLGSLESGLQCSRAVTILWWPEWTDQQLCWNVGALGPLFLPGSLFPGIVGWIICWGELQAWWLMGLVWEMGRGRGWDVSGKRLCIRGRGQWTHCRAGAQQHKCWHGCMCCLDASTSMCRSEQPKLGCSAGWWVSWLRGTGRKLE